MRRIITILVNAFILFFIFLPLAKSQKVNKDSFVQVKGTQFVLGGKPYYYLGANFWYGMNLGSNEKGRERLIRELDRLHQLGVNNLRVLALSEGPDTEPYRIVPSVQPSAGKFNETLLQGLDFLLSEMSKRKMLAVVCLGDFWHWSGGFGQYLIWAGEKGTIPYPPPNPGGSWDTYQKYVARFYSNRKAVKLYHNAITKIITRRNTVTNINYREDPTIMSWQLGNEPRGLNNEKDFNLWIDNTAQLIKNLDPHHLVNVGSEGYTPYKDYAGNNFLLNHDGPNIDYTTAHIWVQNWDWYDPKKHSETFQEANKKMYDYLVEHEKAAGQLKKPLVIEEFGISRDSGSFISTFSVKVRDEYYQNVFEAIYKKAKSGSPVVGVNFWAWGGEGRPRVPEEFWKPGDNFIGDPPHEAQGWYSVYDNDSTTHQVIKHYTEMLDMLGK